MDGERGCVFVRHPTWKELIVSAQWLVELVFWHIDTEVVGCQFGVFLCSIHRGGVNRLHTRGLGEGSTGFIHVDWGGVNRLYTCGLGEGSTGFIHVNWGRGQQASYMWTGGGVNRLHTCGLGEGSTGFIHVNWGRGQHSTGFIHVDWGRGQQASYMWTMEGSTGFTNGWLLMSWIMLWEAECDHIQLFTIWSCDKFWEDSCTRNNYCGIIIIIIID